MYNFGEILNAVTSNTVGNNPGMEEQMRKEIEFIETNMVMGKKSYNGEARLSDDVKHT